MPGRVSGLRRICAATGAKGKGGRKYRTLPAGGPTWGTGRCDNRKGPAGTWCFPYRSGAEPSRLGRDRLSPYFRSLKEVAKVSEPRKRSPHVVWLPLSRKHCSSFRSEP